MKNSFQAPQTCDLIGIDLGGTKIEVVVLGKDQKITFRERTDTQASLGPQHIFNQINMLYQAAIQTIGHRDHTLGVGTPGSISGKTGMLKNSNTVCLNGLPLKSLLEDHLAHALVVENDANCFALAEAVYGAGKNYDLVFGVIMGTGCGGGIVTNKKIRRGPQNLSGEWGHMSIDPNGPRCFCGRRGCVETYISGSGLEKIYAEQSLKLGKASDAREIFNLAKLGDRHARSSLEIFYFSFGRAFANLINILDPDIIILGGGLSNETTLYQEGIESIKNYVFNDELITPIVKHELGDSAGVIGAALIGV